MKIWRERPHDDELWSLLEGAAHLPASYPFRGATSVGPPPGTWSNRFTANIGHGERCFRRAQAALVDWRQFRLPWTELIGDRQATEGTTAVIVANALRVVTAHPVRVIYTFDEWDEESARAGYALGTVQGHGLVGEERFGIEWNRPTNSVNYGLVSFSRTIHPVVRVMTPWVRRLQRRFAQESAEALRHLEDELPPRA